MPDSLQKRIEFDLKILLKNVHPFALSSSYICLYQTLRNHLKGWLDPMRRRRSFVFGVRMHSIVLNRIRDKNKTQSWLKAARFAIAAAVLSNTLLANFANMDHKLETMVRQRMF